jgi:hypothetical protein
VAVEFALDLLPKPVKAKPKAKPHARPAAHAPRPAMGLRAGNTGPTRAAAPRQTGLRPAQGLPEPAPVDARPLSDTDPYAIDTQAVRAVSALPHG